MLCCEINKNLADDLVFVEHLKISSPAILIENPTFIVIVCVLITSILDHGDLSIVFT